VITVPDSSIVHTGTHTTVAVALVAVARCPHGHEVVYAIPDYDDLDYITTKAADWADEHASNCPGAKAATLRAA
jgi:hypothetical protein